MWHISEEQLAEGRKLGASAGGKAVAKKPAPANCPRCTMEKYQSWMQHLGHLGFSAVMLSNPAALHSLRDKIRKSRQG